MDACHDPGDLSRFGEMGEDAPELWDKLSAWHDAVFQPDALSARAKSLIALAGAHAVRCS